MIITSIATQKAETDQTNGLSYDTLSEADKQEIRKVEQVGCFGHSRGFRMRSSNLSILHILAEWIVIISDHSKIVYRYLFQIITMICYSEYHLADFFRRRS